MSFIPNKEQAYGLEYAKKWFNTGFKQCFEISGGAGTGKTTLVKYIIQELGLEEDEVVFVAYIGKASLALTRKGTPATTIHHLIYDAIDVIKKDEDGNVIKDSTTGRPLTITKFVKKEQLSPRIKLIVCDEGAMVSEKIARDLLSFDIPMIILGDRNQLPPVMGAPMFLKRPDVLLKEPMRQALDSPIVFLAQKVIRGEFIKMGKYSDKVFVISKDMITDKMLLKSDIVICHRNSTREELNNHVRHDVLGITQNYPCINEKMICRQNNWGTTISNDISLINGLIGYVTKVDLESYNKQKININFRPEFMQDDEFKNIAIDYKYLNAPYSEKRSMSRSFYNKFEYAYAITCHLAQGSEYERVLVYNEEINNSELYKKWLYTAITRSSSSLILAL